MPDGCAPYSLLVSLFSGMGHKWSKQFNWTLVILSLMGTICKFSLNVWFFILCLLTLFTIFITNLIFIAFIYNLCCFVQIHVQLLHSYHWFDYLLNYYCFYVIRYCFLSNEICRLFLHRFSHYYRSQVFEAFPLFYLISFSLRTVFSICFDMIVYIVLFIFTFISIFVKYSFRISRVFCRIFNMFAVVAISSATISPFVTISSNL